MIANVSSLCFSSPSYGVKDTMTALEMGAIKTLIVWEHLEIERITVKNHQTDGA